MNFGMIILVRSVEYISNFNNKTRPNNRDDEKRVLNTAKKIFMMVENQLSMLLRADYFR